MWSDREWAAISLAAEKLKQGAYFLSTSHVLQSALFEVVRSYNFKMSWGTATLFIHVRLRRREEVATSVLRHKLQDSEILTIRTRATGTMCADRDAARLGGGRRRCSVVDAPHAQTCSRSSSKSCASRRQLAQSRRTTSCVNEKSVGCTVDRHALRENLLLWDPDAAHSLEVNDYDRRETTFSTTKHLVL